MASHKREGWKYWFSGLTVRVFLGWGINSFSNPTVWDLLRCWWSEPHSAENCKCFGVCGIRWHPGKLLQKRNVPPPHTLSLSHTHTHTHTSHHSLASYTKRLSFLLWHAGQIRLCWCKYQIWTLFLGLICVFVILRL